VVVDVLPVVGVEAVGQHERSYPRLPVATALRHQTRHLEQPPAATTCVTDRQTDGQRDWSNAVAGHVRA